MTRPGWQGQVGKARSDQTGRIGKIGQKKQRIKKSRWIKPQSPQFPKPTTNGESRLKRDPKGALAKILAVGVKSMLLLFRTPIFLHPDFYLTLRTMIFFGMYQYQ